MLNRHVLRRIRLLQPSPVTVSSNVMRVGVGPIFENRIWAFLCLPIANTLLFRYSSQLRSSTPTVGSASSRAWHKVSTATSYLRGIKRIYTIPLALGFVIISISYRRLYRRRRDDENGIPASSQMVAENYASRFQISLLKFLPLRIVSRCWGIMNSIYLPTFLRSAVIGSYSGFFGCAVNEAEVEDLRAYRNLGEFFRRSLKPGVRPIAEGNLIVAPTDGTVVHFGRVEEGGQIEQVKGISYSLQTFIGPKTWQEVSQQQQQQHDNFERHILMKKDKSTDTDLFHCVIYLAPGDYHKFHSPADWKVFFRRHFPGKLLSVKPSFVNWLPGIFNLNERVAYMGEWMHGFCSMIAVGATNVGSIKVHFDKELTTNKIHLIKRKVHHDKSFSRSEIPMSKGQAFGEFNLGSTVVLVFEAPKEFEFAVSVGDKVKYGQALCGSLNELQLSRNSSSTSLDSSCCLDTSTSSSYSSDSSSLSS